MVTNLKPPSPDALLKIVEQVKEYYVEPPPKHQRGRPRTFSGRAFLLLAVVAVVLRTFKPQELHTLLGKDLKLRQAPGVHRVPIGALWSGACRLRCPRLKPKSKRWESNSW